MLTRPIATTLTTALLALGLGLRAECNVPVQRDDADGSTAAPVATEGPGAVTTRITSENGDVLIQRVASDGSTVDEAVPGQIVVKFRDVQDADETIAKGRVSASRHARLEGVMRRHGMRGTRRLFRHHKPHLRARPGARARDYGLDRIVTVQVAGDTRRAIQDLRDCPEVEYAHPNYRMTAQWEPNDPYFSSSGAWTQSFPDLWGLYNIGAPSAWDVSRGAGVTVAVVDTGVDAAHPDLAGQVATNPGETGTDGEGNDKSTNGIDDDGNGFVDDAAGWDFVNGDADPFDDYGHGTHVAGTIAAVGDNGIGIVGVAPQASILPVKVLDSSGSGTTADVAQGIVYAADLGAGVINLSLGGSSDTPPQVIQDAVAYAHDATDAVVVAAAGNSNADVEKFYPANLRGSVAVAAVDHADQKASFSNYGDEIDVAAPGGGDTEPAGVYDRHRSILSLASSGVTSSMSGYDQLFVDTDHHYLRQAGTSMAAPHVAGVAALLRSVRPQWTAEQIRGVLRVTAQDVGTTGWDKYAGYGRIDAAAALAEQHALAVHLSGPLHKVTSRVETPITGELHGDGLASWILDEGAGTSPSHWYVIAQGTEAPATEVLATISSWDDTTYTLRLRAWDSQGRVWEDRMPLIVDSIEIDSPAFGSIFKGGAQVQFYGTVASRYLDSWTMDIKGLRTGTMANPALQIVNGGTGPVIDGLLATWDTSGVEADQYTACIWVEPWGSQCVMFAVDPLLHTTWQANALAPPSGPFGLAALDNLTAADVDGDGAGDLLLGFGSQIDVLDVDGEPVAGWPQTIDPGDNGYHTQRGPGVADLDGDGQLEIFASNNSGGAFVWHLNGESLSGWPLQLNAGWSFRFDASDLTGDGRAEALLYAGGNVRTFDGQGNELPGSPAYLGADQDFSPLAVGDVDGDGSPEFVGVTRYAPYSVYVRHADGTLLPGWPLELPTDLEGMPGWPAPTLGDLDGDGAMEIVVNTVDGVVHVLRGDATELLGWPSAPMPHSVWPSDAPTRANPPLIADLDGDGQLEVICGGYTRYTTTTGRPIANDLYAWRGNGTLLPGWPVVFDDNTYTWPNGQISITSFGFGQPIAVDVDADGLPEIVVASDASISLPLALHAYKLDGTEAPNWPRPTMDISPWIGSAPVAADLDGDGLLELAWLDFSGRVYVYDLPTSASEPQQWPMFRHDGGRSGAIALPVVPVPTLTLGDASVEEGEDGTRVLTFTVTRQ